MLCSFMMLPGNCELPPPINPIDNAYRKKQHDSYSHYNPFRNANLHPDFAVRPGTVRRNHLDRFDALLPQNRENPVARRRIDFLRMANAVRRTICICKFHFRAVGFGSTVFVFAANYGISRGYSQSRYYAIAVRSQQKQRLFMQTIDLTNDIC